MRRTKEEALETRRCLMESALDMFGEKNFASVRVSEIAARVGLSKGAFYWHFRNKHDILFRIVDELCMGDIQKAVCFYGITPNAGFRFKDMLSELGDGGRWQKIHRMMLRHNEWPADVQQRVFSVLRESLSREIEGVEVYIKQRQEIGEIKSSVPPRKAAMLITSVLHGLALMQLSGLLPNDFAECIDTLFEAFEKELKAIAGAAGDAAALAWK